MACIGVVLQEASMLTGHTGKVLSDLFHVSYIITANAVDT